MISAHEFYKKATIVVSSWKNHEKMPLGGVDHAYRLAIYIHVLGVE
jgi:hypothetical protein